MNQYKYDLLLEAVKLCHRKHGLGDGSIGWDELEDELVNTLCEVIGDKEFQKFIKEYGRYKND